MKISNLQPQTVHVYHVYAHIFSITPVVLHHVHCLLTFPNTVIPANYALANVSNVLHLTIVLIAIMDTIFKRIH